MDLLLYQQQSLSVLRCFTANGSNSTGILQLEISLDHLTNFESTVNGTT